MLKYKHLFIDLDHTIWDFASNEKISLNQLYEKYNLADYFLNFNDFFTRYEPINKGLWDKYRNSEIKKQDLNIGRFYNTFITVGFDNYNLAGNFAAEFVRINPYQKTLIPHSIEVLEYLKQRYNMHIITNGFTETQHIKIETSGLKPFFNKIFISEEVGYQKPRSAFFEYALKSCNARKKESLVIGDSLEADIKGAMEFGLDHVYFNPGNVSHTEKVFKEISSLLELKTWL